MKISIQYFLILFLFSNVLYAQRVLHVGPGKLYADPTEAAREAKPGDTILIHPGNYRGSFFISDLKGRPDAWITISGTNRDEVIFEGGVESMHFSDVAFLRLSNFTVRSQTGNGLNIDDAGSFDSPSKQINIQNCVFRDMDASGNNDLLKLSGLDSFSISNCLFQNGAAGGSGIDMVGCHVGIIGGNRFINLGSNSIQAKGACSDLIISGNHFTRGGQRCLNLGGSTGLPFFRPAGANYEAKSIWVVANIIEYSYAAIAYVGCRNVNVVNNTIIQPENWIIRILQESSDTSFFQSCANNSFVNNIVVIDNSLSRDVNIGPYTSPNSFLFSHNLWYNLDVQFWQGPQLPVANQFALIQLNPLFVDMNNGNYRLMNSSPALRKGMVPAMSFKDFDNEFYLNPPSLGAFESDRSVSLNDLDSPTSNIIIYPNPAYDDISIHGIKGSYDLLLVNESGIPVLSKNHVHERDQIKLPKLLPGMYQLFIRSEDELFIKKLVIPSRK